MPDTAITTTAPLGPTRRALTYVVQWFDTDYGVPKIETLKDVPDKVDWVRAMSFVILHVGCLGVIWTGWSWFAVGSAVFLYFIRMFAVTGFYHRYFSHRTFSTSRAWQFVLALWGATCVQKGALGGPTRTATTTSTRTMRTTNTRPASTGFSGPTSDGSRARGTSRPTIRG